MSQPAGRAGRPSWIDGVLPLWWPIAGSRPRSSHSSVVILPGDWHTETRRDRSSCGARKKHVELPNNQPVEVGGRSNSTMSSVGAAVTSSNNSGLHFGPHVHAADITIQS